MLLKKSCHLAACPLLKCGKKPATDLGKKCSLQGIKQEKYDTRLQFSDPLQILLDIMGY